VALARTPGDLAWHGQCGAAQVRQPGDKAMISGYDHVAITVADLDVSVPFYEKVLGAEVDETHEMNGKVIVKRIKIGDALMNMHQQGNGVDLVAMTPLPGSQDLCFRWQGTVEEAKARLESHGVAVIEGPAPRVSSDGRPAQSVYFRDPDGNLLELLAVTRH
jgi:catechol 2,3-dioxygenase-like lactoylglutathione lyase family enzyme